MVVSLVVGIGFPAGCRSTGQVPTAADQQAILTALIQYEQSKGGGDWSSLIRPIIRAQGNKARAEYKKNRANEQIAFNPIAVELEKKENNWVVTAEKCNWPWWWHVINCTVGLK